MRETSVLALQEESRSTISLTADRIDVKNGVALRGKRKLEAISVSTKPAVCDTSIYNLNSSWVEMAMFLSMA